MSSMNLSTRAAAVLNDQFGIMPTAEAPAHLSASTRRLAARYLAGEIGAAMQRAAFSLDPWRLTPTGGTLRGECGVDCPSCPAAYRSG